MGQIQVGGSDTWTIQVNYNDNITVSIGEVAGSGADPHFNPWIRLRGPDGAQLADDWDSNAAQLDLRAPSAGLYTVLVANREYDYVQGGPANYSLTVAKTPGPYSVSSGDEGGPITNGASHAGVISVGDLDPWTFQATANDSITISIGEMPGSGADPRFQPWIRLRGPDGALLGDGWDFNAAQLDLRAPSTGTYTVLVSNRQYDYVQAGPAGYSLTIARSPGPYTVSSGDEGGPITNGASHAGVISVGDLDPWTFQATANDGITVSIGEVAGNGADPRFQPWIRLRGPDGALLGDEWDFNAAQLDLRATLTGTYTVVVTNRQYDYVQAGPASYSLTVAKTPGPYSISAGDEGGPMTSGAGHAGVIGVGDLDPWTFRAAANDNIALSINEGPQGGADPRFNPWIRLRGPDGALLGDQWDYSTARLNVRAPLTGTYSVVVTNRQYDYVQAGPASYSLEVSGLTVTVLPPAISAFSASPSTIVAGQSSTLSWTTSNATTVSISGVPGTRPVSGSVPVNPSATTTYTLTATGAGGTATATTTVVVTPVAAPTVVSFAASPSTILAGQTSTLSWSTTNSTTVSISGVDGAKPANGSVPVSPSATTTCTLTATGTGGKATATTTVVVTPVAVPTVVSFAASPPAILAGQASTLSWSTTNATTVSISGVGGTQPANGSVTLSPVATTTYTLTATGTAGTATATTTITVGSVTATLDQLRFTFRSGGRRRAVGPLSLNDDIIQLTRRTPEEHFTAPVIAAINDEPFTQVDVADGVLTLSGTPGERSLEDWLPNGSTARISITNGDGVHFAVILRRALTEMMVVAPELDSLAASAAPPAATITLTGRAFSSVPAENDVIMVLPDARIFHLSAKHASETSLEIVMPLLPSADQQAFYSGAVTLSVGTAPGYVSRPVTGTLLELPPLTTAPGVVLSQTVEQLRGLVNAVMPIAGSGMTASGFSQSTVQLLQSAPNAVLSTLSAMSDAALAGVPRSFDVETVGSGVKRIYVDAHAIELFERLLLASDALTRLQALHGSRSPGTDELTTTCGPTAEENHIRTAAERWLEFEIDSDLKMAAAQSAILMTGASLGPEGLLGAAVLIKVLETSAILESLALGAQNIELQSVSLSESTIHLRAGEPRKVFVVGVFQSPLLHGSTIEKAITKLVGKSLNGYSELFQVAMSWAIEIALKDRFPDFEAPRALTTKVFLSPATTRFSLNTGPAIAVSTPCEQDGELELSTTVATGAIATYSLRANTPSFPLMTEVGISNKATGLLFIDSLSTAPIAAIDAIYGAISGVENSMLHLTVSPGAEAVVGLSAARSSDPLHGNLSYAWQVDGVAAGTGAQTSTSLAPGSYSITLVATNETGETGTAGLIVGVSTPLGPPIAGFTMQAQAKTATEGQTLSLNSTAAFTDVALSAVRSIDPSGKGLAYSWKIGGASRSGLDTLASLPIGTSEVTLSVSDKNGIADTANGSIVVTAIQSGGPTVTVVEPTVTSQQDFTVLVHGTGFLPVSVVASVLGPGCVPACSVTNSQLLTKSATAISFAAHSWQSGVHQIGVRNGANGALSNMAAVTVLPRAAMSGTLSPASPSCTISSGSSTCTVPLTWTTTNPVSTSKVTSDYPSANTTVGTGNNSSANGTVPHSGTKFYLYNNNMELDSSPATASCASSTTWNGSTCSAAAGMSGTLSPASPSCTIASGSSTCDVPLTWTTTNPVSTSKVTSDYPSANTTVATGNNSSANATVPHSGTKFYLYNNNVELDSSPATANCASGTTWNGSTCGAAAGMSGTLSPASPSCTIASGASTCTVPLTWTTTNPVSTSKVTSDYPSANTTVGTGNNSSANGTVPHNGTKFFLYNNGVELDNSPATASCASGTTWNGSTCSAAAGMSGTLSPASPSCTIVSGSSTCDVTLTWTTTNPVSTSKVTSDYPSANTTVGTGNNSSANGTVPHSGTKFFLYNNNVELDNSPATASCTSGTTWNGSTCAAAPMSGTLSPASPSCTISSGSSTCTVPLTWTTTNPVSTSKVTSDYPSANTTVGTGNNSSANGTVPHSGTKFYLYNNNVELDSSPATASCASGTTWNGSTCAAAPMSGTLSPGSPSCTISSGSSTCTVPLTWTTTNPVSTSKVTSDYPSANTTVGTGNNSSANGTVPHNGTKFYLYNNNVELDSSPATASCASGTTWNGSTCAAPMSGTLSPGSPSCTISSGSSTCTVPLTWTTTNPVSTSKVTSDYPSANTTVGTGNNSSANGTVPHNGTKFYLYNNNVELDSSPATASCASGTTWNGSTCQAGPMSGILSPASPSCTIASGASTCTVPLTWTTTNPVGTSKVTSSYPSANTIVGTGNNSSANGTVPHSGVTFYLYNNGAELDRSVATASCKSGTTWNGTKCQ